VTRRQARRLSAGWLREEGLSEHQTTVVAEDADAPIDDKDVVYSITTFGADFDVDGLIARMDRGDIFRPKFQRNFVWTERKASQFIESILLGLPVPGVFLYREDSQRHLIVDGLQRLTSLHSFVKGRFPDSNKVFRLTDVKMRFSGRTIDDLTPEDQRRFRDYIIHATIIMQNSPDDDNSSVYHIFNRLNSNATPLQPQEIRSAIYHGRFQELLGTLNSNKEWRKIFGPAHKRAKDQELMLRFFALRSGYPTYHKPMAEFLNKYMERNRDLSDEASAEFSAAFSNTCARIVNALGAKPFRPKAGLNVAIYDAIMVAVNEVPAADADSIRVAYARLLQSPEFLQLTSRATSDERSVRSRIAMAREQISATADS
jgi:hypothetical protein